MSGPRTRSHATPRRIPRQHRAARPQGAASHAPTPRQVFLALSRLRRRKWDASAAVATELLERNAFDQQVWWLKCRALTSKHWIDDSEVEEEGLADLLLDDNATAQLPRPGTSLANANPHSGSGPSPAVRPMSQSGRPLSGFARPGSGAARPGSGVDLRRALTASRLGTAMTRPVTTSGRFVRLGTASMQSAPGPVPAAPAAHAPAPARGSARGGVAGPSPVGPS